MQQCDDSATPGREVRTAAQIRTLYDRLARVYDAAAKPFGWFGTRRLMQRAIAELRLRPGDTVVDLGTGTGRNLPALLAGVGPSGLVIGVDISPKMLERARVKVEAMDGHNVELIEADISTFAIPEGTDAVLSTFVMEMPPNYDAIIEALTRRARPGARIALSGLRHPERWPESVVRIGSAMSRPFGVSDAYRSHRPWESVRARTIDVVYDEAMWGAVYLAAGTVPAR